MNGQLLEIIDLCMQCCNIDNFFVSFEYNGRLNRFEVRIYEKNQRFSMISAAQKSHWFICQANNIEKLTEIKKFLDGVLKKI